MTSKIGFACVYNLPPDHGENDKARALALEKSKRVTSTTIKWLQDNPDKAEERLWEILKHNVASFTALISHVGDYPEAMRMVRLSSNFATGYTHEDFKEFYQQREVRHWLKRNLAAPGKIAKHKGVKLSMHPSQFCTLAADQKHKVQNSIDELEYHGDIIRYMQFGKRKLDFKLNIHLNGQGCDDLTPEQSFRKFYKKLSPEVQRCLTLENDEFSSSLDDVLNLSDLVGIVVDIHHHWVNTRGEYLSPKDPRLDEVIASWKGVRPTMHYSVSREQYLEDVPTISKPVMENLPTQDLRALRQHSMFYPNLALNRWALSFLPRFDIMCEAKAKNLASYQLYDLAKGLKLVK